MEQIVNQAAKIRFMLGGKVSVPLVMRFPAGSGTGAAAQHSQSLEAWFAHVPGLKVVQPSTPHDAKGLLLAAIDDPDPVMIFEHKLLYKMKGHVPEGHYAYRSARRCHRREGTDVTIVASAIMVHRALEAAESSQAKALMPRSSTCAPCARSTRRRSSPASRRRRLMCVYEGVKTLGIGAEISAMIAESEAFDYLDAPIVRLGRRRNADPLQSGAGEGGRAAGTRHCEERPRSGQRGSLGHASRSDPAQGRYGYGERPDLALVRQ